MTLSRMRGCLMGPWLWIVTAIALFAAGRRTRVPTDGRGDRRLRAHGQEHSTRAWAAGGAERPAREGLAGGWRRARPRRGPRAGPGRGPTTTGGDGAGPRRRSQGAAAGRAVDVALGRRGRPPVRGAPPSAIRRAR